MATKRKTRKRRRGASLRMPSVETKTPAKMNWGAKPQPKANAESAA